MRRDARPVYCPWAASARTGRLKSKIADYGEPRGIIGGMYELKTDNAADYLFANGRLATGEQIAVRQLFGGVSNTVLLITQLRSGERFILKQARARLNVQHEWLASLERIWREVAVLRLSRELINAQIQPGAARGGGETPAAGILPQFESSVPQVLWEDRPNYVFAMSAAPAGHRVWKEMLLAGETRLGLSIATACGRLMATLHAKSWDSADIAQQLDDRTYFDELRVDPYYRHLARRDPALRPAVDRLMESVWHNRLCLVHGDFSPKNLLVWAGHLMLIDFEVGHYGDPAFDLGFFLTHLILKSRWAGERGDEYIRLATTFWNTYRLVLSSTASAEAWIALEGRAMWNLAGCLLARVDGKSPVDYLSSDQQDAIRRLATSWLRQPPPRWDAAATQLTATPES